MSKIRKGLEYEKFKEELLKEDYNVRVGFRITEKQLVKFRKYCFNLKMKNEILNESDWFRKFVDGLPEE